MTEYQPEAAHAASELDEYQYDDAAPEGFGIAAAFVLAAIFCLCVMAWAVLA